MTSVAYPTLPRFWERFLRLLQQAGAVVGVGSVIVAGALVGSAYLTDSFPFQSGGTPVAGTCTTVSQYGIAWTFNKAVPCAQFVTGDWAVAPASGDTTVTITSMSPPYVSGSTNGWQVNPTDSANQGYDSRIQSGGTGYNAALVPALPYAASPDSSIVKSISTPGGCGGANNNFPCLDTVAILTVLGSLPSNIAQTFRPPEFGSSKPLFDTSQLDTSLLPSLAPPAGTPTLATFEARMQRPQFDPLSNFLDRFAHPFTAFYNPYSPSQDHAYGADASGDWNDAMLRLMLNDSLAQKQTLLNYVIQAGIDEYGWRTVPHTWGADGGHYVGRKILVTFAATLLGDSNMAAIAGDSGWDDNLYISFSSLAGAASTRYFTNSAATGMALWGDSGCNEAAYDKNQTAAGRGAGCRTGIDPYSYIDGGETPGSVYQSCCTYANQRASSLIARLLPGAAAIYNLPDMHRYIDRMADFGAWTLPDPKGNGVQCSAFNLPVHSCRYNNGWASASGTIGSITNGNSTFQTNMWTTYRPTSLFCGSIGCGGGGDTTPPAASITAPSPGTVSGTVIVSANASDDSGTVSGVQFKLDGVNLGAEDVTSPYSVSWDTTTASNSSHTLTAVARDPSGNLGTSAGVTVTVNNSSGLITGASLATCPGGGCTQGAAPDTAGHIVTVTGYARNDSGGSYGWYVPNGLQGKAAVLVEAGCNDTSSFSSGMISAWGASHVDLAINAHRYMGIALKCPQKKGSCNPTTGVCTSYTWVSPEQTTAPSQPPTSDTVYFAAVVHDFCPGGPGTAATKTFGGVTPDCDRIYAIGASTGGHMVNALRCSTNTVTLFRGFARVGANDGTDDGVTTRCFYQGDKTIWEYLISGSTATQDPYLCGNGQPTGCGPQAFFGTREYEGLTYFGCAGPAHHTSFTTAGGNLSNIYDYGPSCVYGSSAQVRAQDLIGGGHAYGHLDGTPGNAGTGWVGDQVLDFFDGTTN